VGHRREDLTPYPVLFWPVAAYLVIYRAERQPIEIVAVTQGSRDIPAGRLIGNLDGGFHAGYPMWSSASFSAPWR
jgi:hypothetical protein